MNRKEELTQVTLKPLNTELVLELWSRTYNTDGKPDWTHIFPYYHDEIVFQDPIQKIEGKNDFIAMCNKLTERCYELKMDISSIAADKNEIFMEWKMTMIFRRAPSTPLYGCTKLTLGLDSRITHQRDYYELWGDIFNNVPIMDHIYPCIMRRIFG